MKILQLYYPEERLKLPREDAWAIDKKSFIFAVADGKKTLEEGDTVVFATDGFEDYLRDAWFRKALATLDRSRIEDAMAQSKKVHFGDKNLALESERTLIAVQVDQGAR